MVVIVYSKYMLFLQIKECIQGKQSLAQTPCGTIEVIAPEALEPGFDHRVDVWGVGVIFYNLLTSTDLFSGIDQL